MSTAPFLSAQWRFLVMLNYEVDPGLLRAFVPRGTELDTWYGRTYVSVVGFLFLDTRVLGMAIPFHRDFEEVNLRFYVKRQGPDGWRRGVVFIKEVVPRWAIATVARVVYNERCVARPMSHRVDRTGDSLAAGAHVEYSWRAGESTHRIHATVEGESRPLVSGSEEEFITEHYWGYVAQRDGGCVEYQVEHPSWRVWQTREAVLECDAARVYGPAFAEPLAGPPRSAFVAGGSGVVARRGTRIC